jgi:glucose-6-phosphate isomerase
MFAITGKPDIAKSFGVPPDNIMPLPDWLGGRFSLWGCITFPIILTFGPQLVDQLLHGARLMDEHFATAPAEQNAPLQLALAHLWQRNFMGCEAHAIIPYADALRHLPAYIQQLEMESNGKPAAVPTVPVIFGGVGTTVQHSFMQWFHQSQSMASCDLISVDKLPGSEELSLLLRRNVLAQSSALAHGAPPVCPGGRPSNMIFVPELSATTLGALMALYEHKVMLAAHFWGINAFDQPGVELSKQLARQIEKGEVPRSTAPRLERYK